MFTFCNLTDKPMKGFKWCNQFSLVRDFVQIEVTVFRVGNVSFTYQNDTMKVWQNLAIFLSLSNIHSHYLLCVFSLLTFAWHTQQNLNNCKHSLCITQMILPILIVNSNLVETNSKQQHNYNITSTCLEKESVNYKHGRNVRKLNV